MPRTPVLLGLVLAGSLACYRAGAEPQECPASEGVVLQVLGSGGPIADDGRASSAYLVRVDGKSRVLIDAGGGSFLRFGEAGASFDDLVFVGLSHFHTDHAADFPALLKSGYFSNRRRALVVAGPDGGGPFPSLKGFLDSLLAEDDGAFGYLSGYLDATGGLVKLNPVVVAAGSGEPFAVFEDEALAIRIDALQVPHGIVPAIAFRVSVGSDVIVFASDQNGSDDRFVDFSEGADVLVMHLPIPESASGAAVRLHARPSQVGRIAAAASPDRLLLSHFMARSLADLDDNLAAIRQSFDGETLLAEDLACYELR